MTSAILLALAQAPLASIGEIRHALSTVKPGVTIRIAPGTYPGFSAENVRGTKEAPIVIAGSDPAKPPVFSSGIQLSKVSHIEVRDLAIKGATTNGINVDDGGDIGKYSSHVRLRRLTISDLPKGNHDAIKLSGIESFVVEECDLARWGGSGIDMVGCRNGVIQKCNFKDGGDNGVQAKGGTSSIAIRDCRFDEAGQRSVNLGGSTGLQFFRPNLAEMGAEKYEARTLTVEGCRFVGSVTPIAFVGVDGAVVRFNTFFHPGRWAIRILQENRAEGFVPSRKGVFEKNLIVIDPQKWSAGGVNIGDATDPKSFRFADNWWFGSRPSLPTEERGGIYDRDPILDANLNPMAGSPAMGVGAHAWRP